MWEIIENLPGWVKLTGLSIPVVLIFLIIFYAHGDTEAVKIPSTMNEIKQNVSSQVMEETTDSGIIIIGEFHKVGKNLANDMSDPIAAKTVEWGMTLAGVGLAIAIIASVAGFIYSSFK